MRTIKAIKGVVVKIAQVVCGLDPGGSWGSSCRRLMGSPCFLQTLKTPHRLLFLERITAFMPLTHTELFPFCIVWAESVWEGAGLISVTSHLPFSWGDFSLFKSDSVRNHQGGTPGSGSLSVSHSEARAGRESRWVMGQEALYSAAQSSAGWAVCSWS